MLFLGVGEIWSTQFDERLGGGRLQLRRSRGSLQRESWYIQNRINGRSIGELVCLRLLGCWGKLHGGLLG